MKNISYYATWDYGKSNLLSFTLWAYNHVQSDAAKHHLKLLVATEDC